MPRWTSLIPVLALVVMAAACGGGHHGSAPASTTVPSPFAKPYLSLADEANAKVSVAKARLAADTGDLARVRADLRAIADAKRAFDRGLAALRMPPPMSTDAERLLNADRVLEALLDRGGAATSVAALNALQSRIVSAGDTEVVAAGVLRRDLGLPAPPSPT